MKSRKAFLLRLNPTLYEELEVWASADLRSVNAQIEFLLTDAVRRHRKDEGACGVMIKSSTLTNNRLCCALRASGRPCHELQSRTCDS